MSVALVVGHKSTSPGAENATRSLTEFEFNTRLVLDIWRTLRLVHGIGSTIVFRRTYTTLPADINAINAELVVSLHANASHEHNVSGTEVLYYHRSDTGAKSAAIFQDAFLRCLGLRDRGIRGVDSEARGGHLLKNTVAPAVICEPFFIDNDSDLEQAMVADLAGAYVEAIHAIHDARYL